MIVSQQWDDVLVERDHGDVLHIVPVDDLIDHELDVTCVCDPALDTLVGNALLVAHFALDSRP